MQFLGDVITWENSRHNAAKWYLKNNCKIPYWCCTTTQIWVVQPSDWLKNWLYSDRSTTHMWCITSVEFRHLFLRNHFTGEQEVLLQNIFAGWGWVCCWLFSLLWRRNFVILVLNLLKLMHSKLYQILNPTLFQA